MIQIDIDMPKNCFECDKTYKWKKDGKVQCPHINMPSISSNTTNRPSYCPLKEASDNSVLEDIKAEIRQEYDREAQNHDSFDEYSDGRYDAFAYCLRTLNKHMKSEDKA